MESRLKERVLRWAKSQDDLWLVKHHGGSATLRGHPDIYGHVRGVAVFIELKQPGTKMTKLQAAIGRQIEKSGGLFACVDTFEKFVSLMEKVRSSGLTSRPMAM